MRISDGQAGALTAPRSQEAGGLRFDTQDDAFNFAKQVVEDSNRWFAKECPRAYLNFEANNEHAGDGNFVGTGFIKRKFDHARRLIERWTSGHGARS